MKYLEITNEGEVSPEAFTLVGASTKRGESNKIGMFGSGNKYAVAYLMRNGYNFQVYSGENEILFRAEEVIFGGKTFNVIHVGGQRTSITTEMGPEWEIWQVIREFYSNAVDDGLVNFGLVESIEPMAGRTSIYIEASTKVVQFYENLHSYLAVGREAINSCEVGKIYKKFGQKANIFRRGIRVLDTDLVSAYDYDLHDVSINESRVSSSSWEIKQKIWMTLYSCTDISVIKNILSVCMNSGYLESGIDDAFVSTFPSRLSESWLVAIKGLIAPPSYLVFKEFDDGVMVVPKRLYQDLIDRFGSKVKTVSQKADREGGTYRRSQPSLLQAEVLRKALDFFTECNLDMSMVRVDVVEFHDDKLASFGGENEVLLSTKILSSGTRAVVEAILGMSCLSIERNSGLYVCAKKFVEYLQESNSISL